MSGGRLLYTLMPIQYAPFWYTVKLDEGWYKLFACLTLTLCLSEFNTKRFLLLTTKNISEKIYCDVRGKISNFLNKFLHEALLLQPVMILIIFFAFWIFLNYAANFP
jgi:hypothetical protein